MRRIVATLITLAAASACRSKPVSVVVPESQTEVVDISALSLAGDTSWRISAVEDIREHAHGVQSAPIPTPHVPEGAAALAKAAPTARKDAPARGFGAISPETVNADPTDDLLADDEGPGVLRTQVMLDRARFSGGVLNGKNGQNLEKALMFYQDQNGLPSTGRLDRRTYDRLVDQVGKVDGAVQYTLTETDVTGPYYWVPASVYEQAELPCECYASALEMLDERFHTVTDVLRKLNPTVSWNHLTVGTDAVCAECRTVRRRASREGQRRQADREDSRREERPISPRARRGRFDRLSLPDDRRFGIRSVADG